MDYQGKEGVYFAVQYGASWGDTTLWPYNPISEIKFINSISNDSTHLIRVAINGAIKNYDRTFRMVVEKDSTTAIEGVNYQALPEDFIIKANTTFTDVPIKLFKADNILTEAKQLSLKLEASDDFDLSIPIWVDLPDLWSGTWNKFDNTRHRLILSNFYIRPKVWMGMPEDNAPIGTQEAGRFGQFTTKKFLLMCEVMNTKYGWDLKYSDFSDKATMPNPKMAVINEAMKEYLTQLYNEKKPVLEEDGRLMWFMGVEWDSFVGIPYKPKN
jgi:hypothetical protein